MQILIPALTVAYDAAATKQPLPGITTLDFPTNRNTLELAALQTLLMPSVGCH